MRSDFSSTEAIHADQKWFVVDAEDLILGRVATNVARILQGKHKPNYATHQDTGDFVVVVNAEKVRLSGNKAETKTYFRHSGYPGGESHTPFKRMIDRKPEYVIEHAVRLMLPKNALGRKIFSKLKVYAGANHPHTAQQPETLTF